VTTPPRFIKIIDEFTPPEFYKTVRSLIYGVDFTEYEFAGKTYLGVAGLTLPIKKHIERHMGKEVEFTMSHVRMGNENTPLTNYIHADNAACKYACVWYLNEPECETGTQFWLHNETNMDRMPWPPPKDLWDAVDKDTRDEDKWTKLEYAEAKANRAVLFDSQLFHSRYPKDLPLTAEMEPRIVCVVFFNIKGESIND
jgi:hypothetical protein